MPFLMVILLVLLVGGVGTVLGVRLLLRARATGDWGTVLAILAALLVASTALLALTGRLHWIAAVLAAVIPFARRLFTLLGYLPVLRRFLGRDPRATTRPGGAMSATDARALLGVSPAATRAEIIAAHRRLMQKVHPDHGGTDFLAQQLNEARRVLLAEQSER